MRALARRYRSKEIAELDTKLKAAKTKDGWEFARDVGRLTARTSDMWAFGVMTLEMLLQHHPCKSPLPNGCGEGAAASWRALMTALERIGDADASDVEEWDLQRVAQWFTDAGFEGEAIAARLTTGTAMLELADVKISEVKRLTAIPTVSSQRTALAVGCSLTHASAPVVVLRRSAR